MKLSIAAAIALLTMSTTVNARLHPDKSKKNRELQWGPSKNMVERSVGTPTTTADALSKSNNLRFLQDPIIELIDTNPTSPLGLCQADCDDDSQCGSGLMCYKRDGPEDVPGCSGEKISDVNTEDVCVTPCGHDYCVLHDIGNNVNPKTGYYGICEGDCDDDLDCAGDLKCFKRSNGEDVPGCIGNTEANAGLGTDYCYDNSPVVTPNPTNSPDSSSPSQSPVTSSPTTSDPTVSLSQNPTTDSPTTKSLADTPTIGLSNFPSVAPTPLDPSVDSTSNITGTLLDTGNSTNTTTAIAPLARYLRELKEFSCASDEVIDALDKTTFAIVASALEEDPSQEVMSVKTKECTKEGSLITYFQQLNINVLCGSGGCEATAEELEDNSPAAVIKDVINEAIENGSFVATLHASCDKDCGEMAEVQAKSVAVVAGQLVLNTLSPSVRPTSSSPTMKSSTSSSPMTKSRVMMDSPTDKSAAPTSSTSMNNKGNKAGKKGTKVPTGSPTTDKPTVSPSQSPTTDEPTGSPTTKVPTGSPTTDKPTVSPSQSPTTDEPTGSPSTSPVTEVPTSNPSKSPSDSPVTDVPTSNPSTSPVTQAPSKAPITQAPSKFPTSPPTPAPSKAPTNKPTEACQLTANGQSCQKDVDCCSGQCTRGKPSNRVCY